VGKHHSFLNERSHLIRRRLNFDDSENSKIPKTLGKIAKRGKTEIPKSKIVIPKSVPVEKLPRPKSKFIDNSAIEEDDEGIALQSRETTPEKEPEISKQIQPVQCQDCGKFVSGPKVLPIHQKSKKCKNRSKGFKKFSCRKCAKQFNNRHDKERHQVTCNK